MSAPSALPTTTSTPQVFEPRERAAIWATAVIAAAIVLWAAYLLANVESWRFDGLILGAAVAASGAAVTVCCRYAEQRANSKEHRVVLANVADVRADVGKLHTAVDDLRDDHRRIIALLQEVANQNENSKRAYDWMAYTDGVRDAIPATESDPPGTVTPLRPRNGRRTE